MNNCSRCGSDKQIELHHIKHRVDGGGNEPENLTPLCRGCHDYQHALDNIQEHIRKCEKKHQWQRLEIWQYRLQVCLDFNKLELIVERGYKSYWDDIKTHYMSREVKAYTPPEAQSVLPLEP